MAATVVQFDWIPDVTPTLTLFTEFSDTIQNGAGDVGTEETNRGGTFLATVDEALAGWFKAYVTVSGVTLPVGWVFLVDDLGPYRVQGETEKVIDEDLFNFDPVNDTVANVTLVATTTSNSDKFDPVNDTVANVTLVATTTTNSDMRGTDGANVVIPDNIGIADNGTAIANLKDFDPVNDTVVNVTNVVLVATTTINSDMRGTDGANTVIPDNAGITANGVAIAALNDFDPAIDIVANVTNVVLVATTTTNSDMRGTDGANIVIPDNAGITANGLAIAALKDFDPATDVVANVTLVDNVTLVATTTSNSDMRGTNIDDILSGGDVDGFTIEETLKLILCTQAAKTSGANTTTFTIRATDDSKDRITATVDLIGNRTALTLDAIG